MSPASAIATLLALGAAWGLSMPLTKIATSTGHGALGLIFWQLVFVACFTCPILLWQGRGFRARRRHLLLFFVIALSGTLIPNSFSYVAISHLPAGVYSIVISLVPMSAFVIAVLWRNESFAWVRLGGVILGLSAILLMIAPEASLPDPSAWVFVLVGAVATLCYGFEGNYIARFTLDGLDPIEVLFFSSLIGCVLALPLAMGSGQFIDLSQPWGRAEWALVAVSAMHTIAYAGYMWLVERAGPIFASQISYPVTLFGLLGAMVILDERYSGYIWLALALVLIGLALVQPRGAVAKEDRDA